MLREGGAGSVTPGDSGKWVNFSTNHTAPLPKEEKGEFYGRR